MGEVVVAAIAPEVVAGVIELLKKLLRRTTEEQNEIKQNFVALQVDLNIIKDIAKIVMNNNSRNLDGLMTWMEEASRLVNDSSTLLQRIEDQNDRPQRKRRNQGGFHCSKDDERQLNELRNRCDQLTKHNETVLRIIEQNRCSFSWLLCGRCG